MQDDRNPDDVGRGELRRHMDLARHVEIVLERVAGIDIEIEEAGDRAVFFGRQNDTAKILELLRTKGLVAFSPNRSKKLSARWKRKPSRSKSLFHSVRPMAITPSLKTQKRCVLLLL